MALRMREGIPSAGLYAGPLAWLVSLQVNYALVPWICAHHVQLIHPVTVASALISIAGGLLSWRAWRSAGPEVPPDRSGGGRPHRFVALVGVLAAALFTLVILLQGAAALVLQGCER
jgi:hypothetical protein